MSLTSDLKEKKESFQKNASVEAKNVMLKAHEDLLKQKVGQSAIKLGEKFPNFTLKNQKGEDSSLNTKIKLSKYLIISFYRGGWCPYCNIELTALQSYIDKFKEKGANLIAITPETPDNSLDTSEKQNLKFEILTDNSSELAQKIGIAFNLPDYLKPVYEKFGIDIPKHNGVGNFKLPIPATFIINNNGEVIYEFIDVDYTKRLDPEEILNQLKKD